MIAQHLIQPQHVSEMVATIKSRYYGEFSSLTFQREVKVSCSSEEEYTSFLSSLKEPSEITEHIVKNVVKFGIFEPSDFRKDDQIIYVNGKLEIDVTKGYLDILSKD